MKLKNKINLKGLLKIYKEAGVNPKLDTKAFQKDYQRLEDNKTSVLIQILIFGGALFAAGFFFSFLAAIGLLDSRVGMLGLGVMITILSLIIPYASNQKTNTESVSMALMIVGTVLFSIGFIGGRESFEAFLWVSLVVSLLITILAGSHLQKFAAICCFNACAYWLIAEYWKIPVLFNFLILVNAIIVTIGWLKEAKVLSSYPWLGQWYSSILNACSISMIGLLSGSVNWNGGYQNEGQLAEWGSYWWISTLLLLSLVIWSLSETIDLVGKQVPKIPILVGTSIALLLLIKAPGIVGGILLLFLGIYSGYRLLAGQGILTIFFFTVLFYYNLNTTLLFKSMLMIGAGLLFLALGAGMKRIHDSELSKPSK
ncbi:DUF4401 domain-containing protein [Aureispira sp. CCB-E]|uniref:DUF4401 domain-containing protein n=1 Tax=Aureispira sp. CCB-E TaxID=3051121 RepID=UPI0028690F51|nr:DUF4401 domain-containing protein [Aureispira sp. CCB-E]WMX12781.1 DUF4401 domain-containing protein [Aureispira sp. CCB-E]